jgi:hypothetical protein
MKPHHEPPKGNVGPTIDCRDNHAHRPCERGFLSAAISAAEQTCAMHPAHIERI